MARKQYETRSNEIYTKFKYALYRSNDEVMKCDPEQHVEGR